jgi:tungstate transport system ATP-binding protein
VKPELFTLEDVRFRYGERTVLNVPNFTFHDGKIYALVGPNGAGKTTMLYLLNLLVTPSSGRILYRGIDVYGSGADLVLLRRQMSMLVQSPVMFSGTVFRNVAYGLKVRGIHVKDRVQKVDEALRLVDMRKFADRKARNLSVGEMQRIALARALAVEPRVLFLDEPAAHMDLPAQERLERLLKRINRELGTSVIFSTHSLNQADRLADEVVSIFEGSSVAATPENLYKGRLEREDGRLVFVAGSKRFVVETDFAEARHMTVNPKKIAVSTERPRDIVSNSVQGQVNRIQKNGPNIDLQVDVGVFLLARISLREFEELKINIGSFVYLSFEPADVKVF